VPRINDCPRVVDRFRIAGLFAAVAPALAHKRAVVICEIVLLKILVSAA
jgi:hypothetical protein